MTVQQGFYSYFDLYGNKNSNEADKEFRIFIEQRIRGAIIYALKHGCPHLLPAARRAESAPLERLVERVLDGEIDEYGEERPEVVKAIAIAKLKKKIEELEK